MVDHYIGKRESNRGCFILLIFLIACGIFAWWLVQRDKKEKTEELLNSPLFAENTDAANAAPTTSPAQATTPASSARTASTPAPISPQSTATLAQARQSYEQGDYGKAREQILGVLQQNPSNLESKALASEIHTKLALSPAAMEEKAEYTVKRGDTLGGIAKKHGTTVELIQKSNNLSGSLIRAGQRLRILNGSFKIHVDKSDNVLEVFLNDRFFKRYQVGTGEYNKTPVGVFKVTDRIAQPTWWRPDGKAIPYGDPENELGTHWLSLDVPGYGLHGTWEPESIGKQESAGCIRMLNEEIEELYALIPLGTPVEIRD